MSPRWWLKLIGAVALLGAVALGLRNCAEGLREEGRMEVRAEWIAADNQRELRERQALNALRQAESQVAAAEQAVAERQRAMDRLQQQRDALSQRIVGDCAARMGRLAAYASATQEDLDDQLERTEYALIDDEDALSEAREQAAQARAAWLRTVAQRDAAHTLVGDARKAVLRERDTRLDREDPPARAANALF